MKKKNKREDSLHEDAVALAVIGSCYQICL